MARKTTQASGAPKGPVRSERKAADGSGSTERAQSLKEKFKHGAKHTLRGVRLGYRKTAGEVAEAMGAHENFIKKIETSPVSQCSVVTLMDYVEALGARLELVVVLGNGGRAILVDPEPAANAPAETP